ncbi:MAG: 50S ribosomal protein L18 [Andreesenia angusta]|nr:50S ribosomal protein L18 [Andreesenia angusta]
MIKKQYSNTKRKKRHMRARVNTVGTPERPRLNVFRSHKNIYAQIIDDSTGTTLVSASSLELRGKVDSTGNKEAAKEVGKLVAERAKEKGIENILFDRGGYIYHGRVKELAEGARENGLKF